MLRQQITENIKENKMYAPTIKCALCLLKRRKKTTRRRQNVVCLFGTAWRRGTLEPIFCVI